MPHAPRGFLYYRQSPDSFTRHGDTARRHRFSHRTLMPRSRILEPYEEMAARRDSTDYENLQLMLVWPAALSVTPGLPARCASKFPIVEGAETSGHAIFAHYHATAVASPKRCVI